jgi:hypothetical protein
VYVKRSSRHGRAKPNTTGWAYHWCGADCLKRDYEQDRFLQTLAPTLAQFSDAYVKDNGRKRRQGETQRIRCQGFTLACTRQPSSTPMTLLTPRLCAVGSLGFTTAGTKARQVKAAVASCEGDTRSAEQQLEDARALNDCYQAIRRRPEVTAYIQSAKDEDDAFNRRHRVSRAERAEVCKCLLLQVRHPFSRLGAGQHIL